MNENEVCSNDPLKDMDIRATGCKEDGDRSVDGGRFQTDERPDHDGIDLLNAVGDPVYAAEGGTVWSVSRDKGGYGYYVIVKSGDKFHFYTHLKEESRVNALDENGDAVTVNDGMEIGKTGTSGNASTDACNGGPSHVHYEIREGNSWGSADPLDPENHLGTEFDSSTGAAVSDSCN